MVVMLIIAILIAVAIPTFLGARQKAQDRAAESNLRNALTVAKTAYVDSQNYASDVAGKVYASLEPSLTFKIGTSTGQAVISMAATESDTVYLAARSASGECFFIRDDTGAIGDSTAGTSYGKQPSSRGCDADGTLPTFGPSW